LIIENGRSQLFKRQLPHKQYDKTLTFISEYNWQTICCNSESFHFENAHLKYLIMIMKKVILSFLTLFTLFFATQQKANAQTPYRTAIGLGIDLGDGETLFGPQIKHNFGGNDAVNAQVLFGDHITVLGVDYSYNRRIQGARGLYWYIGVGPQVSFIDYNKGYKNYHWKNDDTHVDFAIRPALGLEFRIPSAPLAMHFDWKPWWNISHDVNFDPSSFSMGFKFVLK
jgi:hypothetical protein